MTGRDEIFITRLIEWIVSNADFGDITELCDELNVDEMWFGQFYDEIYDEEDFSDGDEEEE